MTQIDSEELIKYVDGILEATENRLVVLVKKKILDMVEKEKNNNN